MMAFWSGFSQAWELQGTQGNIYSDLTLQRHTPAHGPSLTVMTSLTHWNTESDIPKTTSRTSWEETLLQILEKHRKGRGCSRTGFQYQSNLKHTGHSPPQLSYFSAPVTPMYVPCLFISVHSHSHLSHAIYPVELVENHSRDEVSKQTDMKLMKILIFQEVPEPPISKPAS